MYAVLLLKSILCLLLQMCDAIWGHLVRHLWEQQNGPTFANSEILYIRVSQRCPVQRGVIFYPKKTE